MFNLSKNLLLSLLVAVAIANVSNISSTSQTNAIKEKAAKAFPTPPFDSLESNGI